MLFPPLHPLPSPSSALQAFLPIHGEGTQDIGTPTLALRLQQRIPVLKNKAQGQNPLRCCCISIPFLIFLSLFI